MLASCGDGLIQPGEQCDDANANNDDFCTTLCQLPVCGDGFLKAGFEDCDDGNGDDTDDCTSACEVAICGDGFVHAGVEECDDDNNANDDDCTTACEISICGDGVQAGTDEQCDDGNADNTDACTSTCQNAACGDGFLQAGVEQCDDGNNSNTDACPGSCVPAYCGDNYIWVGMEQCDDADNDPNDGCDNCVGVCGGGSVIVQDWGGWTYYKVPVMGTMTDTNIAAACTNCGMLPPCQALAGCTYNDNFCAQTGNETSCGNPMLGISHLLCGANVSPPQCMALWGVYQYMGHNWNGDSACGAEQNSWCSAGNSFMNKYTLCVIQ